MITFYVYHEVTLLSNVRSLAHVGPRDKTMGWDVVASVHSGLVYTMDHEVRPWKRAFFNGPGLGSCFDLHDPISLKFSFESLGPVTRCKPNVDQEE